MATRGVTMAIKEYRQVPSDNPEISAVNVAIADFTRQLTINPMLDGLILDNVVLGTAVTMVSHKLGRPWVGWVILTKNAAADVYAPNRKLDSLYLSLQATAPVTVSIRVF